MRNEGDRDALLAEFKPVEVLEPAVVLNVVSAVAQAPVALCDISHKQVLDKALSIPSRYTDKY